MVPLLLLDAPSGPWDRAGAAVDVLPRRRSEGVRPRGRKRRPHASRGLVGHTTAHRARRHALARGRLRRGGDGRHGRRVLPPLSPRRLGQRHRRVDAARLRSGRNRSVAHRASRRRPRSSRGRSRSMLLTGVVLQLLGNAFDPNESSPNSGDLEGQRPLHGTGAQAREGGRGRRDDFRQRHPDAPLPRGGALRRAARGRPCACRIPRRASRAPLRRDLRAQPGRVHVRARVVHRAERHDSSELLRRSPPRGAAEDRDDRFRRPAAHGSFAPGRSRAKRSRARPSSNECGRRWASQTCRGSPPFPTPRSSSTTTSSGWPANRPPRRSSPPTTSATTTSRRLRRVWLRLGGQVLDLRFA